jgi:hypothetical protein
MTKNDAGVRWRKSTRSGGNGGNCVEVANALDAVRDTKNPSGPALGVPVSALLSAIKTGWLG